MLDGVDVCRLRVHVLHVVFGRLLRDADHHAAACAM
jgi:hypothetical protein